MWYVVDTFGETWAVAATKAEAEEKKNEMLKDKQIKEWGCQFEVEYW